jgi:hypothetical protein
VLRKWLLGIGVAAVAAGILALAVSWALLGLAIWLVVVGGLIAGGILWEKRGDAPLADRPPGPDWIETGERFIDPETGKLVTVYHQPRTGERRYVGR